MVNLQLAWCAFLLGGLAGAVTGMFFHRDDWLGGYASWRRRMIRLGHIAFFGLGLLNLGFGLSVVVLELGGVLINVASVLLLTGLGTMSLVCYLSAWRQVFRNLFFIPALSVIAGVALTAWEVLAL